MPLDLSAIGSDSEPVEVAWSEKDVLLYAVAVGAGGADPTQELAFTTESSEGIDLRVLPTFGTLIAQHPKVREQTHAKAAPNGVLESQGLTICRPIPTEGRALVTTRLAAVHNRGWGALVVRDTIARDIVSTDVLLTTRMSVFLKGERVPGAPPPPEARSAPARPPDIDVTVPTRPEQALLYRLCGDRNPLHSDPTFAARLGFRRPILHGLCTFGITGRVLLHTVCGSDTARFRAMSGRFTRRVVPGDTLRVVVWRDGERCWFRTVDGMGCTVLDEGVLVTT